FLRCVPAIWRHSGDLSPRLGRLHRRSPAGVYVVPTTLRNPVCDCSCAAANVGAGEVVVPQMSCGPAPAVRLAVGDFNEDGKPDVATIDDGISNNQTLCVCLPTSDEQR